MEKITPPNETDGSNASLEEKYSWYEALRDRLKKQYTTSTDSEEMRMIENELKRINIILGEHKTKRQKIIHLKHSSSEKAA